MTHTRRAARGGRVLMTLAGAMMASAVAMPALAADVTNDRMRNADSEPQNWLSALQNYSGHRYSRLDEINRDNVAGLHVAFTFPITTALQGRNSTSLDGSPLVDDGIMYFDDGGGVFYKLDVSAGGSASLVWTADATVSKDVPASSRGMAMWGNALYHGLRDGRVVAVDRDSGEFLWDVQRAGIDHPGGAGINISSETFSGGTSAMGGHIIVSNSNGDGGTRGWIEALDPETGAEEWRTYAIPGPGEPGHETWEDDHNAWKTGGAGMWTQGTYDPDLDLLYWGTANPVPMFDPEFRPGDNLYTNTLLALNASTGDIAWYFQYVPNESWDYDENGVHFLVNTEVNGETRSTVQHFGRNGFYYIFDRTTGEFLANGQYVDELNWTAGLDPKTGLPVEYNPDLAIQEYIPETRWFAGEEGQTPACPNFQGGTRWQYPAYNPDTGIAYSASNDGCFILDVVNTLPVGPDGGINVEEGGGMFGFDPGADFGGFPGAYTAWYGSMRSVDASTGERLAVFTRQYQYLGGVMVTAGGLVFTTTIDGYVVAHDADTLEEVWSFYAGIAGRASPISYSVNGKQYIATFMASGPQTFDQPSLANMLPGAMLYVFSL
ncbi:MAG: PQQ-binding-like beta-propeller repeat protein [Bauldia sp.]|nr:PQQ-binding-like beta-propeller repeat protein [Bauldia sp.]